MAEQLLTVERTAKKAASKQSYQQVYDDLNDAQKLAVDTIEGPVLVVAGPGTGKTQLLSVRVGSILQKDPTILPSNILCLTFTDAAAANLRERLIEKVGLGQDAYQVAIHTFNSFGAWIMATFPQYFFEWREAVTADELTAYQIIENLMSDLPGTSPLAGQAPDGTFFALKQVQSLIGDAKKSNLSPEDLIAIVKANRRTFDVFEPIINKYWPGKMSDKGAVESIRQCVQDLRSAHAAHEPVSGIAGIDVLIMQELLAADAESNDLPPRSQTKPFTAWKDSWLEKGAEGKWQFKARNHIEKLLAAADLYAKYQTFLEHEGMVDFNDQIVSVLAALEQHEELRLNLQERFQYIMIDEYQDTNRAQLQLARHITDAAVHEGRPNILVVGDDDQAIYRFQGADMSNIAAFEAAYTNPVIIPLTENYRSNNQVISPARGISTQIQLSLEKQKGIDKTLGINVALTGQGTQLHEFTNDAEHYSWIAHEIRRLIDEKPGCGKEIAVLARKRDQLDALVPYLHDQHIPMDYERRENILEQEHIVALLTMARVVHMLSQEQYREANALLPEVLSHPMWQIPPVEIWKVAREAYDEDRQWLDVIFEQDGTALRNVADFLYNVSQQAAATPLEHVLDTLLGQQETAAPDTEHDDEVIQAFAEEEFSMQLPTAFISRFKRYYFGDDLFNKQPAAYLTMLSHLACLRRHIRNYQQGHKNVLHLSDLIDFVATYQRTGMTMTDTAAHREDDAAVKLMTAHKAKGQEFDTVFVIGLNNDVWGKNVGSNNSRFSYPQNLNEIKPSDNDDDDALRLLFVAMTRAKQNLHLCYFKHSEDGKAHQPFAPLLALDIQADQPEVAIVETALVSQYEQRWLSRHAGVEHADKHALLADKLERYQLSVTHLNNFLDVSRGGPLYFLTQNLLNFPASMSPNAGYGSAIHKSLQFVHEHVASGKKIHIDAVITYFESKLREQTLSEHDTARFLQKGTDTLRAYLKEAMPSFTKEQMVEFNFAQEGVVIQGARLKGALDVLDYDKQSKSVTVTDYKTGRGYSKWDVPPSSDEYERIKLHHYKQQLLFYKLLVDGSSTWGGHGWKAAKGALVFVEPDSYTHKFKTLPLEYLPEDLERLRALISAVWQHIMRLDFPEVSNYEASLKGIQQFEQDLLDGKI